MMFEQTFVQTGKTNKGWTVMVSLFVQCGLLVIAVILPMVYFEVLPAAQLSSFLVAPPPPPPPPPPPAAAPVVKIVKVIPLCFWVIRFSVELISGHFGPKRGCFPGWF